MTRHRWSEIRKTASAATISRAEERTREMLAEMPLHELRQARKLTQETLAEALGTSQANVSKLERRTDMYVGTLRRYVEAMGGHLEITAHFPDGEVRINQFHDLEASPMAARRRE